MRPLFGGARRGGAVGPSVCRSGGERDSPGTGRGGAAPRGKMAASLWLRRGGQGLTRLLLAGRGEWRCLHGTRELLGE